MTRSVRRQMAWTVLWGGALVLQVVLSVAADVKEVQQSPVLQRQKRAWDFSKLFIYEEIQNQDLPHKIGQLSNTLKHKDAEFKISGDGAGTIFTVAENGEVWAIITLDREKQSSYKLTAEIRDVHTKQRLEPDASFTVIVSDINDNPPVFSETFIGSINERSKRGTAVMTIKASDADDPTSPNGKVEYRLLNGTQFFSINSITGQITVEDPTLDREIQNQYKVIVRATDTPGIAAGLSANTIVTININDINDNTATFKEPHYQFHVKETEKPEFIIGTLSVEDKDEKQNKNPKFTVESDVFYMELDEHKNGVLRIGKGLDFETKESYIFKVLVKEDNVAQPPDNKYSTLTTTQVSITVIDVDEPPVFGKTEYTFNIPEGPITKKIIGSVSATDPDQAKYPIRYFIEGINCPVDINENTGQLVLKGELDREQEDTHICNVKAQEISSGNGGQSATAIVKIHVDDINDNQPELSNETNVYICENDKKGTIIGTVGATDKDLAAGPFRFSLAKKSANFSLHDNQNGTASILLTHGDFSKENLVERLLEIEISDGGSPPQKSIRHLYIRVCKCRAGRRIDGCMSAQAGVSVSALIAILLCIVTILVIVILFVLRKRYQKENLVLLGKSSGEIHEQLVSYDEEGGGEMDTNGYDVSILSSACQSGSMRPSTVPAVYAVAKKPSACKGDMAMMIEVKKDEADHDRDGVPYDTLHIYGYEGTESLAGSLSSLDSSSTASNLDYDFLSDWGPRFRILAQLYGVDGSDSDSSY